MAQVLGEINYERFLGQQKNRSEFVQIPNAT